MTNVTNDPYKRTITLGEALQYELRSSWILSELSQIAWLNDAVVWWLARRTRRRYVRYLASMAARDVFLVKASNNSNP